MKSPETQKRVDDMMRLVHTAATFVLEQPASDREAAFARCRELTMQSARDVGMSTGKAAEKAAMVDEFTRALVKIIELGGAPEGGHA